MVADASSPRAMKVLGIHLITMISHSESIVTERHEKDRNQWSKKFTWFVEEVSGGEKSFPVISHRLPFSHWEIILIFPVKQCLCNLDHHQTKSRKQLQTKRCEGQMKGNLTYNAPTTQCCCFLTLAEVVNMKTFPLQHLWPKRNSTRWHCLTTGLSSSYVQLLVHHRWLVLMLW